MKSKAIMMSVIGLTVGISFFAGRVASAQEPSDMVARLLNSLGLQASDVREITPSDILLVHKRTDGNTPPLISVVMKFQDEDTTCYVVANELGSISCVR